MASYQVPGEDPYHESTFTTSRSYDSSHAHSEPQPGVSSNREGVYSADVIKTGKDAVLGPKGVTRLIIFFCSLLGFSIMASFSFYEAAGPWKFVVAANVIAWLYSMAMIGAYFFRKRVDACFPDLPIVEFGMDGILLLLTFVAAVTAAAKCNGGDEYEAACTNDKASHAGIAFTFLNAFAFVAAIALSWIENKKLEAQQSG